jgi:hypothetical protein
MLKLDQGSYGRLLRRCEVLAETKDPGPVILRRQVDLADV